MVVLFSNIFYFNWVHCAELRRDTKLLKGWILRALARNEESCDFDDEAS